MPTEIDSLQIKISTQSENAAKGIDDLIVSLGKLKNVKYGNSLEKLATALKPLSSLNLNGFKNAMNSLAKIPNISKSLDASTINAFAASCNKLSTALSPLADKMAKVGSTFAVLPTTVKKTTQAVNAYSTSAKNGAQSTQQFGNILDDVRTKIAGISVLAHQVGNTIGQWINNSNAYVENVNLFTVSMGEYAGEAMEYAERIRDLMGVDLSEFIRNQGIFMSMATGFGLATDKAYEMSKGLTELSYDLSSFFNISLDAVGDGAFAKVQSGIAGELEPLRRLGFALSEASLQEVAYAHGIDLSIEKMTEAQKATLRYTAMVEQAADMGAIGDMARTLITPANALRILKQQFTELSRALGNLFIPLLIKVLPYLQALTKVLTAAIQRLAVFFGFELPTIDYSGLENVKESVADTSTGLGEAAKNAKKLKSQMLGIDELNVVSKDDSSGAAGASGNGYGSDLGLDVSSIWDESMLSKIKSDVDALVPKMEKLAKVVGILAGAFAAIKIGGWIKTLAGFLGSSTFVTNLKAFVDLLREGSGLLPTLAATFPRLANGIAAIGGGSLGAGLGIVAAAIVLIGSAIYYATQNFDQIKRVAKDFFNENIAPKIEGIKESFQRMGETLQPIADFFRPVIDAVKRFFVETLGIKSVGDIFEFIGGVVFHVLTSVVAGAFNMAVGVIENFVYTIEGIVSIVDGVVDLIVSIFTGDLQGAWDAVKQIGAGIVDVFAGLWGMSAGAIVDFVEGVVGWFGSLFTDICGEDGKIPAMINGIVGWFAAMPKTIIEGLTKFGVELALKFDSIWAIAKAWWKVSVAPWFTVAHWKGIFSSIGKGLSSAISDAISSAKKAIDDFMSSLSFDSIGSKVSSAVSSAKNAISNFANSDIVSSVKSALDYSGGFSLTIPKFADGGFIEDGLFTMNQGEIAGKFNNGKSVVANNEQIIAGISDGVYQAVVAAMGSRGNTQGEQNVNVYLDGKQIYASVKKTESERGKQLFGNQLGYGF